MINYEISRVEIINDEPFVFTQKGCKGCAISGPYYTLEKGNYIVEFELGSVDPDEVSSAQIVATLDVVCDLGKKILAVYEVPSNEINNDTLTLFRVEFNISEIKTIEFRMWTLGICDLKLKLKRRLIYGEDVIEFPSSSPASPFLDLNHAAIISDGYVPMYWSASGKELPFANFGDTLGPIVVAAISGLVPKITPRNNSGVRLITAGTIIQFQERGYVHVWGAGLEPSVNASLDPSSRYIKPEELKLRIHAVRGPLSRKALIEAGVGCPKIFGDPGWLLPKFVSSAKEKKYELGIIPHVSELKRQTPHPKARTELKRYEVGFDENDIKVLSTYHEPSFNGFLQKINEITSCKRIISASFHGYLVAQAYGIPSIYFATEYGGLIHRNLYEGSTVDRRICDFMLGAGYSSLPIYAQYDLDYTNWGDVIKAIDASWEPLVVDIEPFIDAFPLCRLDRWHISDKIAMQMGMNFL
ncbi:MAG: polysaccharide pyruvyl transferase family protein [Legionella sp.]|nr:polysaccharide pyruvyl transferase family protein [Legionella sp.]